MRRPVRGPARCRLRLSGIRRRAARRLEAQPGRAPPRQRPAACPGDRARLAHLRGRPRSARRALSRRTGAAELVAWRALPRHVGVPCRQRAQCRSAAPRRAGTRVHEHGGHHHRSRRVGGRLAHDLCGQPAVALDGRRLPPGGVPRRSGRHGSHRTSRGTDLALAGRTRRHRCAIRAGPRRLHARQRCHDRGAWLPRRHQHVAAPARCGRRLRVLGAARPLGTVLPDRRSHHRRQLRHRRGPATGRSTRAPSPTAATSSKRVRRTGQQELPNAWPPLPEPPEEPKRRFARFRRTGSADDGSGGES